MISKEIAYTDANGVDHEETFYFGFTQAELMKLNLKYEGGLEAHMKSLIGPDYDPDDPSKSKPELSTAKLGAMLDTIEYIIKHAYGVKTEDGRFIKGPVELERFVSCGAYDELFMDLITHPEESTPFVQGLLPKQSRKRA